MNTKELKLIKETLLFYAYEAEAINRNLGTGCDSGVLASIKILELDSGNRARQALSILKEEDEQSKVS